jgi:hypothetical protein
MKKREGIKERILRELRGQWQKQSSKSELKV